MRRDEAGPALRPATPRTVAARSSARWWLGLSAALLVVLATAVGTGGWQPARLTLRPGGLVMVLHTVGVPPDGALRRAVDLLLERLAAAGYGEPSATVTGAATVTVRVTSGDADGLRGLAAPGRLSFHAVLNGPVTPVSGMDSYLLGPAGVEHPDLAGVSAVLDAAVGWSVRVRFTPAGQARWAALTAAARQVAVVVDRQVVAAPRTDGTATPDAHIAVNGMDQAGAVRLAALLAYGPLPVVFTVSALRPQP